MKFADLIERFTIETFDCEYEDENDADVFAAGFDIGEASVGKDQI